MWSVEQLNQEKEASPLQQLHRSQQHLVVDVLLGDQSSQAHHQHTGEGQDRAAWRDQSQVARQHLLGGRDMDMKGMRLAVHMDMARVQLSDPLLSQKLCRSVSSF